ncbi:hypothetical protein [Coleofasciculus sp. G2-EDA-02]|uniref:hypothetical protein n=1 Tax=Coleofasciculus sp. G2-EDA-02 TaxID=3069529 RepID=UPI0032F9B39B
MRDLDLSKVVTQAGFDADNVIQTFVPNGAWKTKLATHQSQGTNMSNRGTWFIVAASK